MTLSFGFNFQFQKSGENIVVNNDSVFWEKQYVDACKLNEHCSYFWKQNKIKHALIMLD